MTHLELRKKLKSKKPNFVRQDAHKKSKLKKRWIKPRGLDSKMRYRFKGYRRSPSKGWKSPKSVRSSCSNGLMPIIIKSINELNNIDKEKQGIIIAKSVGSKKRIDIIKKAQELNLQIINIKDPDNYVKKIQDNFENRKKEKRKKSEEKEKRKKETEKKAKEKKKEEPKEELAEKISEEEEKKKEKKEKDKILTKKE